MVVGFLLSVWGLVLLGLPLRADYQDDLQLQLLTAQPGDTIILANGVHQFTRQLSITVDNVTLRGACSDCAVLDFSSQSSGGEGILVAANGVVLEDFSVMDTPGDGIKVFAADGATLRRLKVRWTGGPDPANGAYGLYPVLSRHVLIEHCLVEAASDAGIYLGQSEASVIRFNEARYNVAGIEVENSQNVDVYGNSATFNTGGVLVFNLPGLSRYGETTRVYDNYIAHNNTPNYAPGANVVGDLPTGTGLMITANKEVEVFNNLFESNQTAHIVLASYTLSGRPTTDPQYNPYVEAIAIHHNQFLGGGQNPTGGSSAGSQMLVTALRQVLTLPFPAVLFDGALDPLHGGNPPPTSLICITDNQGESFANFDAEGGMQAVSYDLTPHDCRHGPLPAVVLP